MGLRRQAPDHSVDIVANAHDLFELLELGAVDGRAGRGVDFPLDGGGNALRVIGLLLPVLGGIC